LIFSLLCSLHGVFQPKGLKGSHVRTVMLKGLIKITALGLVMKGRRQVLWSRPNHIEAFVSQPYTDLFTSLIYQTSISMADLPEHTLAVSSIHTCALVGSNLSPSDITRLGRAENWIARTSKGPDTLDINQSHKPPGWLEQETAKAAKFHKGATEWVVAGLTKLCLACSVSRITLLSDADLIDWHCKTG
jgi:hypothetical protein